MYSSPSFGLLVSFHPSGIRPLCAFIVSKKVDLHSVIRHQVKRKLADSLSPCLSRLPHNLELVFLAKKTAVIATREELKGEVEQVLHRARLL